MTPSARRQARRIGARLGREIAELHSGNHLAGRDRILKRLRDPLIAATILEGFWGYLIVERWRPVALRAFRRSAIGLLRQLPMPPITNSLSKDSP